MTLVQSDDGADLGVYELILDDAAIFNRNDILCAWFLVLEAMTARVVVPCESTSREQSSSDSGCSHKFVKRNQAATLIYCGARSCSDTAN